MGAKASGRAGSPGTHAPCPGKTDHTTITDIETPPKGREMNLDGIIAALVGVIGNLVNFGSVTELS